MPLPFRPYAHTRACGMLLPFDFLAWRRLTKYQWFQISLYKMTVEIIDNRPF